MTKLVKPLLELKKRVLSPKQKKQPKNLRGDWAEQAAISFLQKKDYKILSRNVCFGKNELDIIALDKKRQEIVFVEVKSRKTDQFGHPSIAVNHKKINAMWKVAKFYLKKYNLKNNFRFDIISVLPGNNQQANIEHFENITWP